jgi:proteasome lid subunit RPN8/RPN11
MNIKSSIIQELIRHAQSEAPVEACGYLAEKGDVVTAQFRMKNVDASSEHFSFDPAEQFAVVRQMRTAGERLRAVYHSHPASPGRPSLEDIRLAYDPSLSYVIISLAAARPDVKSYRIRDGQVAAEPLNIIED